MMFSTKGFKNLLKFPRYDYEVWSKGRLLFDGSGKNRAQVKYEFERVIDELHLKYDSGDGFTFIVQKP